MRFLIADDHALYRDGLKFNLNNMFSSPQITEATCLNKLLEKCNTGECFDMIITNIDMCAENWENIIKQIKNKTSSKIGIMATSSNVNNIKKAIGLGVSCYLPKNIDSNVLKSALNLVLNGGTYFPNSLFEQVSEKNKIVGNKKLTNRQAEVLKFLSQGLSNKQIAYQMNVSEATVKLHINALLRALGATNRTQAVIKSQKLGIV